MNYYRHTQIGWTLIFFLGLGCFLVAGLTALTGPNVVSYAVFALLALCLLAFTTMTVTVNPGELEVILGRGLIRNRIALHEIETAAIVRNPWYYGWGIKFIPGGRLWNVHGFHAVEVILLNRRRYRIGTDDPQGLIQALAALGVRRRFSCAEPLDTIKTTELG